MGNRTRMIAALALAAGTAACTATVYEAQPEPPPPAPPPAVAPEPGVGGDVSFFYDSLSPYGSWVSVATYGEVWVPRVDPWWRPYTDGRWAYTDAGWTWVAAEPWGWAAFHYGRWYWDAGYGWAWVPGTVWAPAWVAWRSGGGHIGWAPLPPQVRWEAGVGFSTGGVGFTAVIAPQNWCFVEERDITAPALREVIVPRARNVTFVNITNNITNYTVINNRIVNDSIDVNRVEQVTHRPVPRYRILDRDSPAVLRPRTMASDEIPMIRHVTPLRRDEGGDPSGNARGTAPTGGEVRAPITSRRPAPAAATTESVDEVNRRHQAELQALAAHEAEAKARLQEIHRTEQAQAQANATAEQVRAHQLAEQKALEAQQREEGQGPPGAPRARARGREEAPRQRKARSEADAKGQAVKRGRQALTQRPAGACSTLHDGGPTAPTRSRRRWPAAAQRTSSRCSVDAGPESSRSAAVRAAVSNAVSAA